MPSGVTSEEDTARPGRAQSNIGSLVASLAAPFCYLAPLLFVLYRSFSPSKGHSEKIALRAVVTWPGDGPEQSEQPNSKAWASLPLVRSPSPFVPFRPSRLDAWEPTSGDAATEPSGLPPLSCALGGSRATGPLPGLASNGLA